MVNDPQKRKLLYDALTSDGYQIGSFEEFSAKLENPEKVKALYDGITKDGYNVGDYQTFYGKVGPSKSAPEIPAVESPTEARPPFGQAPPEETGGAQTLGPMGLMGSALPSTSARGTTSSVSPEQKKAVLELGKGPISLKSPEAQAVIAPKPKEAAADGSTPDLIGASRITQEPDMASVAVDQTNTLMTPGEQEFRKEFAPMDLAAVKEFKKKIPQKMQLIQQQQAGLEADKKALEEARVQLESDLAQAQQQMAENPAIAPQLQAQHQADVGRYNQMVASANKQAESIKDLARSVEADYQKADLQEYNLKSQQGGFFGASHNKIVEGVLSMASVVPEISIDLIAGLTPESMLPSIGGEAGKSRDQLAKEWKRDIIPAFKEAGMDLWRSGTTEEYEAEMSKGILGRSWLGLMQSAPAMATPMMSGIFLQVYDGAKEEMRGEEWDGVPEGEKNAMAALLALPATALERMGFSNLAANNPFVKQLLARSLASLPKNATKEQIEAVINAETTDAVMNYVIRSAGATISEAETGGVQYITDVAIKDMFNRFLGEDGKFELPKSWGEYAQGTVMSMADEGMGGLIMGQIPALAAARRAKKNVGEVTTDTQFELLEETLKNPEYLPMMQEQLNRQVESGKISKVQADDAISAWKESQQIVSKIPEDLPTEKRREAFDLLTQKDKLSKMDKALVGDKIAAIDAKLINLAGAKPAAKEGDVKTEAPTATQDRDSTSPRISWGDNVVIGRGRNGAPITQWEESDASKNPSTGKYKSENVQVEIDQYKDGYSVIVAPSIGDGKFLANKGASKDGFATAQEAEDHALRMIESIESRKKPQAAQPVLEEGQVTPTAKGPASPVDGEMTVKSFAESIASGNRLDTPEAVQFYENNKKEIEAELQRMAGVTEVVEPSNSANEDAPNPGPNTFGPKEDSVDRSITAKTGEVFTLVPADSTGPLERLSDAENDSIGLIIQDEAGEMIGTIGLVKDKSGEYRTNNVFINPEHRGKGIATETYKYIDKLGVKHRPSKDQTNDGARLWPKKAAPTAEGPVRPEAPAAAPTPNKETVAKMKELDKVEEKMSSGAKKLNAPAKKAFNEMVASDPRLEQVKRVNFEKAVTDLEKSGKLKVRCP